MAEIPDVVAGTTIESAWGNQIRDRAVMRYANAAARDASEVAPVAGRICYLDDTDSLYVYEGTVWVKISDKYGDPLSKADLNSQQVQGPVTWADTQTHTAPVNGTDFSASGIVDHSSAQFRFKRTGGANFSFQAETLLVINDSPTSWRGKTVYVSGQTDLGMLSTHPDTHSNFQLRFITQPGSVQLADQADIVVTREGYTNRGMATVQSLWVPDVGGGEQIELEAFVVTGATVENFYGDVTLFAWLLG